MGIQWVGRMRLLFSSHQPNVRDEGAKYHPSRITFGLM